MRKVGVGLLVALLLLPVSAGAVVLRYRLRVGEEQRQKETLSAKGVLAMETAMGQQNLPIEVTGEELRSLKVVEAAGREEFVLESRSLRSSASYTMMGESQGQEVPGQNFRMRVNTLGDVRSIEQLEVSRRGPIGLDLQLDSLLQAARLVGFPATDLEVGATWAKEIPVRSAAGQATTAQVQSRLERVIDRPDGPQAVISSRYRVPIPPTEGQLEMMGMQIPIRIEGTCTGESTTTWDVNRGRSLGATGKGQYELKLYLLGLTTDPAVARLDVTYTSVPVGE